MHEDSIERLYKRFQEAWIDGKAPDPEAYCRRHLKGEEAMRLQARIEEFLFTDGCLRIDNECRGRRSKEMSGDEENAAGAALGDFRLLREIGRGGMGVVYEARQESLNRTVALKVLPAHLTLREESVARFQREASTAARLKHPGIVKIHAVGEEEGAYYFAMEFVEGAPLNKVIDRIRGEGIHSLDGGRLCSAVSSEQHVPTEGPGPEKEAPNREDAEEALWKKTYIEAACRLVIQVAEALDFAHSSGVIHRDVKPSNILVRRDATAVLTDFGLAREEGLPSLSITGEFAGTPHYISPEQTLAGRKKVDHRSDIYSLGVTLFELLTLSKPFDGKTSQEVLGKILSHEPPLPRGRNPLVPRDLDTICMTAMEKDPDRRYPSAKEFGEDLKRFLEFKPIRARPVGMMTRTYRVIRRNPAYSMVIGLLFLLVVVGPLVFGVQQKLANIRIRDALEEKEKALKRADEEAARARREEETANQVSDYLVEIFKVPMPSEARGRTVTAFEVLQRGVESIEERLADQPAIRTRILETLGVAHKSLGLYSEAEPLLRQALETNVETLGEEHVTTLQSAHHLGMIHLYLGRYDTAESFLEKACEGICRVCGAEGEEALAVKNDLAMLYLEQNRFGEAERIYEQTLEARRRLLGEDHPRTFESMNNLALVYNRQGRFREAEALYLKTIERSAPRLGDDDPDVLTVRSNLSLLYESQGRYDEAERLFLEVLEARRRVLGDDHPNTFNTWNDLALIYKRTGRFREAERYYLRALEGRRRKLDDDHPDTLVTKNNLAALYVEEGSFAEAEKLFREVLELRRRVLGEDHADTVTTLCNLAVLYSMQNRYDDAEPLYDEVLRVRRRIFGDGHPDTLNTMNSVATLYSRQGRFDEAEAMYLRVLQMYRRKYGDTGSLLPLVLCNFAHHYASIGRFDEAEPLAREAVEVTNPRSSRFAARKELHDAILEEVNRRRNNGRASGGEEDR